MYYFLLRVLTIMILFQGGFKDPQNLVVQVLQSHPMEITAYSCFATVTRSTFCCGLDSITYAQKTIQYNKKIFPAQNECISMVEKIYGILKTTCFCFSLMAPHL